jgi:hypothetical protein
VRQRGGEKRGSKKLQDASWAEHLHCHTCWIKQTKLVKQIYTQKLKHLWLFKQQWYLSYDVTACLTNCVIKFSVFAFIFMCIIESMLNKPMLEEGLPYLYYPRLPYFISTTWLTEILKHIYFHIMIHISHHVCSKGLKVCSKSFIEPQVIPPFRTN